MPLTDTDPELRATTVPGPPSVPTSPVPPPRRPVAAPHPVQPTSAAAPHQVSDAASGDGYIQTPKKVASTLISDAASSGGYGRHYYTYRADAERALRPGQKLGFTQGRGYYVYTPTLPPGLPPPTGRGEPRVPTAIPGSMPPRIAIPTSNFLPTLQTGVPATNANATAAEKRIPLTDPNPSDFINATWEQRLAWIATMSKAFGGWFNNIVGIIQYFQGSHYFANDARMKAADGYVLWAIAEGYRGFLGFGPGNVWTPFMKQANAGAPMSKLRTLWATAEQEVVDFSTDVSQQYAETEDQQAMYDVFVYFGNEYRTNVKENDPARILGFFVGSDPRKDQGTVRYAASAVETVYRYVLA